MTNSDPPLACGFWRFQSGTLTSPVETASHHMLLLGIAILVFPIAGVGFMLTHVPAQSAWTCFCDPIPYWSEDGVNMWHSQIEPVSPETSSTNFLHVSDKIEIVDGTSIHTSSESLNKPSVWKQDNNNMSPVLEWDDPFEEHLISIDLSLFVHLSLEEFMEVPTLPSTDPHIERLCNFLWGSTTFPTLSLFTEGFLHSTTHSIWPKECHSKSYHTHFRLYHHNVSHLYSIQPHPQIRSWFCAWGWHLVELGEIYPTVIYYQKWCISLIGGSLKTFRWPFITPLGELGVSGVHQALQEQGSYSRVLQEWDFRAPKIKFYSLDLF